MRLPDDEEKAIEVVRLLLSHGADDAAVDALGWTAAQIVIAWGQDEAAALLRAAALGA